MDNLSKGIEYSFSYKDKNSEQISTIVITKSDCKVNGLQVHIEVISYII